MNKKVDKMSNKNHLFTAKLSVKKVPNKVFCTLWCRSGLKKNRRFSNTVLEKNSENFPDVVTNENVMGMNIENSSKKADKAYNEKQFMDNNDDNQNQIRGKS